jgi:predicted signal transduction protein with EAL and GGDEF domain
MRVARDPVEAANATLTLDINTIIVLVLFSIISAYATFVVSYTYMLVSIPLILTLWLYIKVCRKQELRNIEPDPY